MSNTNLNPNPTKSFDILKDTKQFLNEKTLCDLLGLTFTGASYFTLFLVACSKALEERQCSFQDFIQIEVGTFHTLWKEETGISSRRELEAFLKEKIKIFQKLVNDYLVKLFENTLNTSYDYFSYKEGKALKSFPIYEELEEYGEDSDDFIRSAIKLTASEFSDLSCLNYLTQDLPQNVCPIYEVYGYTYTDIEELIAENQLTSIYDIDNSGDMFLEYSPQMAINSNCRLWDSLIYNYQYLVESYIDKRGNDPEWIILNPYGYPYKS
jgi:hypothetical protein